MSTDTKGNAPYAMTDEDANGYVLFADSTSTPEAAAARLIEGTAELGADCAVCAVCLPAPTLHAYIDDPAAGAERREQVGLDDPRAEYREWCFYGAAHATDCDTLGIGHLGLCEPTQRQEGGPDA